VGRAGKKHPQRQQSGGGRKRLGPATAPTKAKTVGAAGAAPEPIDDKPFRWSAGALDHGFEGEWDWSLRGREALNLLSVLEGMGQLTWREVKALETHSEHKTHRLHHSQPVESICASAQRRLDDLELQLTEVFRLRHGNMLRIWGYVQGAVFYILWFDRNHRVCPSDN